MSSQGKRRGTDTEIASLIALITAFVTFAIIFALSAAQASLELVAVFSAAGIIIALLFLTWLAFYAPFSPFNRVK